MRLLRQQQRFAPVATCIWQKSLQQAALILVINLLVAQKNVTVIPAAVAAWIGSAYFFTSSTSFANPAVTIGRTFTDSFAGIAPDCAPKFIAAQILGAIIGLGLVKVLTHDK
jgi:glycerol uptake facilitator-like aquaporin